VKAGKQGKQMELRITNSDYQIVTDHLEQHYPNEGGGFLVGHLEGDVRRVTEVHPVTNVFATEEQFHRFLAEDGAFQRIEDDADARGLTLLGYFHSHPDHPAIPSEFDRVHALPFFGYLIVSVRDGQAAEGRVWELKTDRTAFNEGIFIVKQPIQTTND
jgi:proteasome lid subunit RPN8/RPN11